MLPLGNWKKVPLEFTIVAIGSSDVVAVGIAGIVLKIATVQVPVEVPGHVPVEKSVSLDGQHHHQNRITRDDERIEN